MAKIHHEISAEERTVLGRKVRQLRRQGLTPATVYGHGFEPVSIQMKSLEIEKLFEQVGESGLVEMLLGAKKIPVLFKNPQYHPVNDNLIHLDCHHVNLKEKITATVPIEFIGESDAVKTGNVMVEVNNEIEVECLPTDLPESIQVDISKLVEVNSQITVADLIIDREKVVVKTNEDQVIVLIEAPRAEEEVITEAPAETVVAPAMNQKTPEELAAAKAAKEAAKKED